MRHCVVEAPKHHHVRTATLSFGSFLALKLRLILSTRLLHSDDSILVILLSLENARGSTWLICD